WIALDQILQGLLRGGLLVQSLLAQSQLVQRRRDLVSIGIRALDLPVLDLGAVERGLREETLSDAVLRVVRQLAARVALDELTEALESERVAPLSEIERCLVVRLVHVAPRRGGRRRSLGDLLEPAHHLVELAFEAAPLLPH